MCEHEELLYIGEQEMLSGDTISLFNCAFCHTTIALPYPESSRYTIINTGTSDSVFNRYSMQSSPYKPH